MAELYLQGLSEPELIQQCISGTRSAQEALYKHFAPKMFGICLRYGSDYHNAEDILQEGFVKVFKNLHKYRGDGSFEGWMKRIFVNTAIEDYRRSLKHSGHKDIDVAYDATVSEKAFESLKAQDLMKLIQKLSTGYRTVFNLYAIEGFSHKEIAEKLGITVGTSKSQLARARMMLQKMLQNIN